MTLSTQHQSSPARSFPRRPHRRLLRNIRSGSVLILVLAVLVLLALMGTAYIATARTDRYAAQQFVNAPREDEILTNLLNSESSVLQNGIVNSLYDSGNSSNPLGYRQVIPTNTTSAYGHVDAAIWRNGVTNFRTGDRWLASSVPVDINLTYSTSAPPTTMVPAFKAVTIPPNALSSAGDTQDLPFVDPFTGNRYGFTAAQWAVPTWKTVPYAGNSSAPLPMQWFNRVRQYPAFSIADMSSPGVTPATAANAGTRVVAADATGQGIGDAGVMQLMLSPIDGETYTVGVRVIDNASRINPNVAWNTASDLDWFTNWQLNCFPSSVNLFDNFLSTTGAAEAGNINNGRDGKHGTDLSASYSGAWFGTGGAYSWIRFASQTDQMFMNYGRRMSSSAGVGEYGSVTFMGGSGNTNKARAYGWTDATNLAYRYGYFSSVLGPSRLDQDAFPTLTGFDSFYQSAINYTVNNGNQWTYLSPSEVVYWFDYYYNYDGYDTASVQPWQLPPDGNLAARKVGSAQTTVGGSVFRPLRPILTPENPVCQMTPGKSAMPSWITPRDANGNILPPNFGDLAYNPAVAAGTDPMLSSGLAGAETSDFYTLWRSYWRLMTDNNGLSTNTSFAGRNGDIVRGPNSKKVTLSRDQTVLLRAAIAAANVMGARETDTRPTQYVAQIPADPTSPGSVSVDAYVYSMKRQPFITQVVVSGGADPAHPNTDYIAVVLFNPYNVGIGGYNQTGGFQTGDPDNVSNTGQRWGLDIRSWGFEYVDRRTMIENYINLAGTPTAATPPAVPYTSFCKCIKNPGPSATIWDSTVQLAQVPWQQNPANPTQQNNWQPYLVIENDPALRPNFFKVNPGIPTFKLPALTNAIGNELILVRPAVVDLGVSPGQPGLADSRNPSMPVAPVDSVNLMGVKNAAQAAADAPPDPQIYVYARPHLKGTTPLNWYCAYAGDYNTDMADGFQGKIALPATVSAATPLLLGGPIPVTDTTQLSGVPTQWWPNPWLPNGSPGPRRMCNNATVPNLFPFAFPFGGFARPADLMEIPYFGSYRLVAHSTTPPIQTLPVVNDIEINAAPVDACFSELNTATAQPIPLGRPQPAYDPTVAKTYNPLTDPHGWAMGLFDYFTVVNNPDSQYSPNVRPSSYYVCSYPVPGPEASPYAGNATNAPTAARTFAASNTPVTVNSTTTLGAEGLINVNTASWKVLSMVQMIPSGVPGYYPQINQDLAKAIVYYRDVDDGSVPGQRTPHGPFKSLFELNGVYDVQGATTKTFQNGWGTLASTATPPPTPAQWAMFDLDPLVEQYATPFLMVNRVSNILTTRSDSFACYIVVQGWRNFGTSSAEMVSQKRAAFMIDRTAVQPGGNSTPTINTITTP